MKFESYYNRLNPEQKQAVDQLEGPVMVLAGPGTGKTQVLATRIGNILKKTDALPENILALTFTDAAAQNMKERVVQMIGTTGYYVSITTFHAFASQVIRDNPDKFPLLADSQPLTDLQRFEIIQEIIESTNFKLLRPLNRPLLYAKDIINQISKLKNEYISPEKFEEILIAEEKQLENDAELKPTVRKKKQAILDKQRELFTVYTKYEAALRSRECFDFADMINYVVTALTKDEDLLLNYQEKFQHILVDEYQDSNASQNKIVDLLASYWQENANIFVVGDPHQSIYRFQGASVENMLGFMSTYPNALVVTLQTGYRCSQEIYSAAHTLILNNSLNFVDKRLDLALNQQLNSTKEFKSPIQVYSAQTEITEHLYVAQKIQQLLKNGTKPEEIAVLYKENKEAVPISQIFSQWNIPFSFVKGENVLEDSLVIQLIKLCEVLVAIRDGQESEYLLDVMLYKWIGLDRFDVLRFARVAGKLRKTLFDVFELEYEKLPENTGLTQESFSQLVAFKNKLLSWVAYDSDVVFTQWLSELITVSGNQAGFTLMEELTSSPVKTDHLLALTTLFDEVKQFVSQNKEFHLKEFVQMIATLTEHHLPIRIKDLWQSRSKVTLSTVHSAKGNEWEHVFIIGCLDKKWGNSRSKSEKLPLPDSILTNVDISKKEKNEDDRRLFYVGLTRAKIATHVSFAREILSNNTIKTQSQSMFIGEIESEISFEEEVSDKPTGELDSVLTQLLVPSQAEPTTQEKEFFDQLLSEFKLSSTALNIYLRDPHEFFLNVLLKVPRAKNPIQCFGTAVHSSLEKFYAHKMKDGKLPTKQELFDYFDTALIKENLMKEEYKLRKQKGIEILDFYYTNHLTTESSKPLFLEKSFGGTFNKVLLTSGDTQIQLSGKIDRIDILDAVRKEVRIIDYKTGKAKTEGQINGTTSLDDYSPRELALPETIRGAYQRQLVFYQLLTQLDSSFKYKVVDLQFDFIEPSGANLDKHVVRSFLPDPTAVSDLKALIIEVMAEIKDNYGIMINTILKE